MTLFAPVAPRAAATDAYLTILESIAPNAVRLKQGYNANLARGLGAAAVLHLLGIGAYWLTVSPAAPRAVDDIITLGPPVHFEPPISPTPPAPPSGPRAATPAAGVVTPVEDERANPDATAPTQSDVSTTPVRGGEAGESGNGRVGEGRPSVPEPYVPTVDTTVPPVPQRPEPQPEPEPQGPSEPLAFAEVPPVLIGGLTGLRIEYPAFERNAGVQGRVIVAFVVDENGAPTNVTVARGVSPGLDQAAVQAVQRARFTPGRQNGRPVKVRFTLPVQFVLSR